MFYPQMFSEKTLKTLKEDKTVMTNNVQTVPIHEKLALTIREAAEYSNIGINKIDEMLRTPNCPFVLFVGKKKLVKRKEFEEFISSKLTI